MAGNGEGLNALYQRRAGTAGSDPLARFDALVADYERTYGNGGQVDPDTQLLLAALAVGPSAPMPDVVAEDLRTTVARCAAGPVVPSPFDLAVATGCGWRRAVDAGATGWRARWESAFFALLAQVRHSLRETGQLFAAQLPQFEMTSSDIAELAPFFTAALVWGCGCGHHVRACGGRSCGGECCFLPHSLASWDPSRATLRSFVDQAVRGTGSHRILGAAFAESLLYSAWAEDGRVLCRPVEFSRCDTCASVFEGNRCDNGCAGRVRRFGRENWLIRPEETDGNYRRVQRWVCGAPDCGSLYPRSSRQAARREADPCPRCGWCAVSAVPATALVWVRIEEAVVSVRGLRPLGERE